MSQNFAEPNSFPTMQTHRHLDALRTLPGPLHLAIGVFDGLHLGHQEVIRQAREAAIALGGTAVVVTFDPHPIRVLRPAQAPNLLTSTRHKEVILARLGMLHLLEIPFTTEFATNSAEAFVDLLRERCQPLGSISVGCDWAFGKDRQGTLATLQSLGTLHRFQVHGTPRVCVDEEPISSTRIRHTVEAGDFAAAQKLLGREYSVLGTIVKGRQLGRKIGFPTANLASLAEQLPPVGVYAVKARYQDTFLPAVANLGYRPTVAEGERERLLEVHLLDFDEDIYDQELEVKFIQRLRSEMRLGSLDELKDQIARDTLTARSLLSETSPAPEPELEDE